MTPKQLKAARKKLGMTQKTLGETLGLRSKEPGRTVRLWEAGVHPVPGPVELAVKALVNDQEDEE